MSIFGRRKPIGGVTEHPRGEKLRPSLGWPHLVTLGVGGTGIYTLIGIAAGLAGPAMIVSFVIAGAIPSARGFSRRRYGGWWDRRRSPAASICSGTCPA